MNTQVSSYFHGNSNFFVSARLQQERIQKAKIIHVFSSTVLQNDRKFAAKWKYVYGQEGGKKVFFCVSDGRHNQTTAQQWKRRRRMMRALDWWTSWTWSYWTSWWVCLHCVSQTGFSDARVKPKVQLTWKMNAFHYKQHPSGERKQTVETEAEPVLVLLH